MDLLLCTHPSELLGDRRHDVNQGVLRELFQVEFAGMLFEDAKPSHTPLLPLRRVFEAGGTRMPADCSAGILKGNLNPVSFSTNGHNDSRSHQRIGDTLGRTRYGTLRGSHYCQSGSGDSRTD